MVIMTLYSVLLCSINVYTLMLLHVKGQRSGIEYHWEEKRGILLSRSRGFRRTFQELSKG